MSRSRIDSGKKGEEIAIGYLEKHGYEIIAKNHKTKYGEIDIIGKDKDYFCFIEVRSKNSELYGLPEDSIDRRKQHKIEKAALYYIQQHELESCNARFDVLCIGDMDTDGGAKINLIQNAFELSARYRY